VLAEGASDTSLTSESVPWQELMGEQKLEMDHIHTFEGRVINRLGPVSHVKLNIYPDGGVSRLRVFGRLK
jgi:allantoicase